MATKQSSKAAKPAPKKPGRYKKGRQKLYPHLSCAPWQKGQSGNPSGRPSKPATIVSKAIMDVLKLCPPRQMETYAALIGGWAVHRIYEGLAKGKKPKGISSEGVALLREMMDRTEGKVTQPITFDKLLSDALSRSEEDRQFFRVNHRWPDEPEDVVE